MAVYCECVLLLEALILSAFLVYTESIPLPLPKLNNELNKA